MFDKQNKVILFIAEKETFMVRVLENKIKEAGFDCDFCGWDEKELASKWSELAHAVIYTDNFRIGGRICKSELLFRFISYK